MEKQKHSKIMSFLNISWSRLPYNSRSIGWVNSHITEQMWKAQDNSQLLPFLTDFELMENCATPNVSECTNSHNIEIFCKKSYSQDVGVWGHFFKKLLGNSTNSHTWVKWNVYYENIIGNTTLFPCYGLWLNIYRVRQVANIPDMGN